MFFRKKTYKLSCIIQTHVVWDLTIFIIALIKFAIIKRRLYNFEFIRIAFVNLKNLLAFYE